MSEYAKQVQFRNGTTEEHKTFIGALAEITVDTDQHRVIVHDGETAGGFATALVKDLDAYVKKDYAESSYRKTNTQITLDDLEETLRNTVTQPYDDTNIKNSISTIIASMLTQDVADTKYASIESLNNLGYDNLDSSLKTIIDSVDTNLSSIVAEINANYVNGTTLASTLLGYRDNSTKISITDLSSDVQDQFTQINTNESNIDSLTSRLSTLETTVANSSIGDISTISTKMNNIEQMINSGRLAYDDTNIQQKVTDLQTKVDTLENYDDTAIKRRLDTDESDIANLKSFQENQETTNTSNQEKLAQIESSLTECRNSLVGLASSDTVNEISRKVDDNGSLIQTLRENVDTLTNRVNDLSNGGTGSAEDAAKITQLQNDVSTIQQRITVLENKADEDTRYDDTEIKNNVQEVSTNLSTLETKVSKNTTDLQATNEKLTKTSDKATANETSITTLQSSLDETNTTISNMDEAYKAADVKLQGDIDKVSSDFTEYKATYVGITSEEKASLTEAASTIDNQISVIEQHTRDIQTLKSTVLANNKVTINKKEDTVSKQMNNLYDMIVNLQQTCKNLNTIIKAYHEGETLEENRDSIVRLMTWSGTDILYSGTNTLDLSQMADYSSLVKALGVSSENAATAISTALLDDKILEVHITRPASSEDQEAATQLGLPYYIPSDEDLASYPTNKEITSVSLSGTTLTFNFDAEHTETHLTYDAVITFKLFKKTK